METQIYYKASILKHGEIDSYEEGCLLEGGFSMEVNYPIKAKTLPGLLKEIKDFLPGSEALIFDNRIDISLTEDCESSVPTARQIENWKTGKETLYYVTYSFYITRIEEEDLEHEQLAEAFPELEAEKLD